MGNADGGAVLAILIIIALAIWLIPLLGIWAINVLLASVGATVIPVTFKTWLATLVIIAIFGGSSSARSSK